MTTRSILIGDAGGTCTDWRLIKGDKIQQFSTGGFNLFTHSVRDFKKEIEGLELEGLDEVYIYAAGADTDLQRKQLSKELKEVFGIDARVENDLLGAARATCGLDRGYVAILGTGANASYYNGTNVEKVSASLGYILGDEGSGAYLGKQLLKGVYRSMFSEEILSKFQERFHLPVDQAISTIYASDKPNQYLASFVPFIAEVKHNAEIYKLIYDAFGAFFDAFFDGKKLELPIHFVGSIAYHFSDILRQVIMDRKFQVGTIIASPIAGLLLHHRNG